VLTRPAGASAAPESIERIRASLLAVRARRPQPIRDTKILTGWNGQMIAALAEAGRCLNEPKYTKSAVAAADFVLDQLRTSDGRVARLYAGQPRQPPRAQGRGFLDDYSLLVHGLLSLRDSTKDERWLNEARRLTDAMIQAFADGENGGFYFSAADHEALFVRTKDQFDGAQPAGNSAAVRNLLRLADKTKDDKYRALADKSLRAFAPNIEQNPGSLCTMVAALDTFLGGNEPVAAIAKEPQAPRDAKSKSDSVVKVTAKAEKPGADGKQVVKITLAIDKGWHIYGNPIGNPDLESSETAVTITAKTPIETTIDFPKGKLIEDKLVGNYRVFEKEAVITATVEWPKGSTPGPLDVSVKLQACNDKTCLLPATVKLKVP
jgi:uncharacterized protein YyaL (SSP411 family)